MLDYVEKFYTNFYGTPTLTASTAFETTIPEDRKFPSLDTLQAPFCTTEIS